MKKWKVTMRFQYPAWDERDGIVFFGIYANSKSEANDYVRRIARDGGHLCGGKGRVTFSAVEE